MWVQVHMFLGFCAVGIAVLGVCPRVGMAHDGVLGASNLVRKSYRQENVAGL